MANVFRGSGNQLWLPSTLLRSHSEHFRPYPPQVRLAVEFHVEAHGAQRRDMMKDGRLDDDRHRISLSRWCGQSLIAPLKIGPSAASWRTRSYKAGTSRAISTLVISWVTQSLQSTDGRKSTDASVLLRRSACSGDFLPDRLKRDMRRAIHDHPGRQTAKFLGKTMVDVAVMCLIGTNHHHHVSERRIIGETPIAPDDLGRGDVLTASLVDLGEIVGVTDHRFSTERAAAHMARSWVNGGQGDIFSLHGFGSRQTGLGTRVQDPNLIQLIYNCDQAAEPSSYVRQVRLRVASPFF